MEGVLNQLVLEHLQLAPLQWGEYTYKHTHTHTHCAMYEMLGITFDVKPLKRMGIFVPTQMIRPKTL